MPARDMTGDLHGLVQDRLRDADQRYTAGRRAIISLLAATGHPVSISDIASQLPALPRSSAYRHLTDLESAGIVRRVAASDEFTRFELGEDLTGHHHHLVCVNCGKVIDITLSASSEQAISEAVGQVADAEGFQPQSHRVDVLGSCASCS